STAALSANSVPARCIAAASPPSAPLFPVNQSPKPPCSSTTIQTPPTRTTLQTTRSSPTPLPNHPSTIFSTSPPRLRRHYPSSRHPERSEGPLYLFYPCRSVQSVSIGVKPLSFALLWKGCPANSSAS